VPQNTSNDIIVYQGNYFTQVSNTIYSNCTQCINSNPCQRPTNVISYSFSYGYSINNGPTNPWPTSPDEICDIIYELYNDLTQNIIENAGFSGQIGQSVSLEIGSTVYNGSSTNCTCVDDGIYFVYPYQPGVSYTLGNIIEISNCEIISSSPCSPINGTSPSNPNGSGGGTGGGAGGSSPNGGNTPGGSGASPSSSCSCTAVRTISGFQGTAFYTDCNGNPAQITVPAGSGIAGAACFCRQANTNVTGAVIVEACQSSFGQGTINNICGSTIQCS
jgi:hypothetical protein